MIRNLKEKLALMGGAAAPMAQAAMDPVQAPVSGRFERRFGLDEACGCAAPRLFLQASPAALSQACRTALPADYRPEDVVFIDVESTGLAGAGVLAFLVGIGRFDGEGFRVEQFLMRDYDQETDMLGNIKQRLETARALVTFNGKCFDGPLLTSRSVLNRVLLPLECMPHLDVLHAARRLYRRRLGSCTLGRLEEHVLSFQREGDIPGAEIPEVFFSYLETREFTRMQQVIDHNLQDILTMMLLLTLVSRGYEDTSAVEREEDVFSLGACLERAGRLEDARACYLRAAAQGVTEGDWALAALYKRGGQWEQAAGLWQKLAQQTGPRAWDACIELAKYHEHTRRDPPAALVFSLRALEGLRAFGPEALNGPRGQAVLGRIDRLRGRMERKGD